MVSDDRAQQHAGGTPQPAEGLQNVPLAKGGQISAPLEPEGSAVVSATPSELPAIVIIDDDDAVRDSARMLLEAYGYVVRDHASAENFLDSDSGEVGFLLVDQHMPGMTGIELLERLHAKPRPPPALMMTGRTDQITEARLARIGVTLLHKPVREDQLVEVVAEALRPSVASQTSSTSK